MVRRKLLLRGFVQPTKKRIKSEKLKKKKIDMGIDCFWTVDEKSPYEDNDVLDDM